MATFQEQLVRVRTISPAVMEKEIFDFIKTIKNEMVEKNREQIFEKSQDIYGNAIGFYSRATDVITKGRKKAGEPFDGKDTGAFLKSFYATVLDDLVFFGASDPKTDLILESDSWLSKDLFGLTDENLRVFIRERILPFVVKEYRQKLML